MTRRPADRQHPRARSDRLAAIRNADRILVIDDGTVAECGTHNELIHYEGLYRRFTEIRERAEGGTLACSNAFHI